VVLFGLIAATIADLALAVLLIAVSGFLFGSGPESGHYGAWWLALFIAFLVFCVVAPIIGFMMRSRENGGAGFLVACSPLVIAVIASMIPPPY